MTGLAGVFSGAGLVLPWIAAVVVACSVPSRAWADVRPGVWAALATAGAAFALTAARALARQSAALAGANLAHRREMDQRRAADEMRRVAEATYRDLVENAVDGIFQTTPGGRYLSANPALARIYGYESPEALVAAFSDIACQLYVEPDRRGEFARLMTESDAVTGFESAVRRRDGSVIWISENARAVRDPRGELIRYEGIVEDVTERRRAGDEVRTLNARLQRRLDRIGALRRIDSAITAGLDLPFALRVVLDQARSHLGVDAACVLMLDPSTRTLNYASGSGFRSDGITRSRLSPGEGTAGLAALDRRMIAVPDLFAIGTGFVRASLVEGEGFIAYYGVPLLVDGEARGVLEVFHRSPIAPDAEWLDFLETLAGQAAIATDNARLVNDLQTANAELTTSYDATIEGWSRALDLRDKETEGHTRRVTEMAVRLAETLGITGADLVNVRRGALLHDIGKMGIPDAILLKPGPLTDDEWRVMRLHPGYAYEWLSPVPFLRPALEIPFAHHEKWDGTGYPRGLKGESIPLSARVFAAVDVWDALCSDRPYRKGWPAAEVVEHVRSLSGTHLDPAVVSAFLRLLADADLSIVPDVPPKPVAPGIVVEAPELDDGDRLRQAREALRRAEAQRDEIALSNARLAELSATDDLTGLKNRRHLREAMESALAFADRQGQPLSLILLDVDRFKSYNDAFGHQAGDEVLRAVSALLREHTRPYDLVARFGGEEFVVLMPSADAAAARILAERLRAAVAGYPWPLRPVTSSFGVTTTALDVPTASALLGRADGALYHSKRQGRDRVTHSADMTPGDDLCRPAVPPSDPARDRRKPRYVRQKPLPL